MAFGLKHWIGLTALGFVCVAVWRLPPTPFSPGRPVDVTHEEARYQALASELRLADATLKRIRWADSLSALVVENGLQEVAVAVPASTTLTPTEVAEIRARAQADLGGIVRHPGMALGHIYQPVSHGSADAVRHDSRGRAETYVGTRDGVDYCFRVSVSQEDRVAENVRYDLGLQTTWRSPLGLCRLYAAHGMPGGDITRWLESGGTAFGTGQGPRGRSSGPRSGRTGLFGWAWLMTFNGIMDDRCFAGLTEACAAVFLDPAGALSGSGVASQSVAPSSADIARRSPAIAIREGAVLGQASGLLLTELEQEFGFDKFHAFWTSAAPVEEAFEAAFGIPVGPWMVTWVARRLRIDPPGPQLAKSTPPAAFLTLGLFFLVAFARNRRRSLG